ncbi:serine hydrolase domain-containing protein [Thalassotalea ponticola]|uniref:serine hydrolase domain-containing protein n=1 Tax=Thalassotalea ponticola TaxID=1523392 RepID=UPI0025B4C3BB|nr:serine hydrolase domain-containing protein [Thalassotalea ponticola]MDN3651670.1 serine hydrolase domain-containing protein [Thalassotalea ponticola]
MSSNQVFKHKSIFKKELFIICLLAFFSKNLLSSELGSTTKENDESCYEDTSISAFEGQRSVLDNLIPKVVFLNSPDEGRSITQRMQELKVSGISIALIKNHKIDWSSALGKISYDSEDKVTCTTLFQAASLSKPITMMGVLNMKEKGVVSLDQNISEYLKSYSLPEGKQSAEKPVTFRNLLNHTSGITSGGYVGYSQGEPVPSDIEILKGVSPSNTPKISVESTPGSKLSYSGGAYTLVEVALQDIFGKSFNSVMSDWSLSPLKMNLSSFSQPLLKSEYKHVALGHDVDGNVLKGGWNNYPTQAAAGLWSTASDLAKFLIEISRGYNGVGGVYSKGVIKELLKDKIDGHYFGFVALGDNEELALAHYGGNAGYRTAMVIHLATGNGAVILTNSDNGSVILGETLRAISKHYNWPYYKSKTFTKAETNIAELKLLAGTYAFSEQGWQVDVEYDKSKSDIAIVFPNNERYRLIPTKKAPGHYVHRETGVEAHFSYGDSGTTKITLYGEEGSKI